MSNRYINEIIKGYEKEKSLADENARLRQAEIYIKIPRIREIDSELGFLGIEVVKSIFKSGVDIDSIIKNQKKKSSDLKAEKTELLTKYNYTFDYAMPKYKCTECSDTGYIGNEKCHCFKQKIIDKYYNQSNLKNIIQNENFDTFVFDYYSVHKFQEEPLSPRKNIEQIFSACINFAKDFDNNNENLFFYGNSGLGKTFLSNCIAKDLLDMGKLVVYQTSSTLVELLKNAKFENSNDQILGKLNDIFESDLLIIDDLGTEYITDFSQMELFNIINKRLIANKNMVISTNLSLDNIFKTYPERITSRIIGNFSIFKFYGDDIRLKIGQLNRKRNKK